MKKILAKIFPERHPFRLLYHKILGVIAAVINGFPGNKMIVIGITGTKGKSTTTNFIANILNEAGFKVGMTSTINFQIGSQRWINATKKSTQSPFVLQKMLKQMLKEGCKYAVIEVTSHAIDQSRIFGINFDVAVVTNIAPEHIEYHGNFNNYIATKAELFKKVSRGRKKFGIPKVLVMNSDDKYFNYFDQFVADRKITYGLKTATVYAEDIQKKPEGSHYILHVPNNSLPIELKIPGEFNVYNALAATAVCMSLQVPLSTIKKALEESSSIAGRFEHVRCGQKYSVIVDYAHTPESLRGLLKLYRGLTAGRLFVVFGATGGGRDKSKRPKMGEIANEFADYIVVTDDDPYEEDEWQIIDQVAGGVPREEGKNFWKIPDREEAIRLALTMAREGDCVVVAGKGSEEVIKLRGKTISWNDKNVITKLLEREIEVKLDNGVWEKRENVCKDS